MSLADLIRGRAESGQDALATATPANSATAGPGQGSSVAGIAAVAVANRPGRKVAARWRLYFADAEPCELTTVPPASRAEMLARYSNASAAEPLADPAPVAMPADLATLVNRLDRDDRPLAREMYAIDPVGTRRLVEGMTKR